jgi:signal transduction histidine kinase
MTMPSNRVLVRVQSQLELQPCELDAKRFKQVVYNLVSNAIKFTPADGQVTVAISVDHGSLILLVTDTGIGIAPEHLSDIFLDFHQLDGSRTRHFEGTGLGLALTRRLVQAQGGDVQVSSVLAQGSEFKVSLPMQQARLEGA